jgi:hypothetical protein
VRRAGAASSRRIIADSQRSASTTISRSRNRGTPINRAVGAGSVITVNDLAEVHAREESGWLPRSRGTHGPLFARVNPTRRPLTADARFSATSAWFGNLARSKQGPS